ncbi:hypothetical protein [Thauera humireducens]|uniref:hypothetical protein n=1 Tax=Thauera humireducens TaxID=1134435 RepID=UPI00311F83B4
MLDCVVDDQDHTHALLADGEVLGCVSTRRDPIRGCTVERLGVMPYLCAGSPAFRARWFPHGLTRGALAKAPAIVFGRHDDMHDAFLRRHFGLDAGQYPHHVVPSSEGFMAFAVAGLGYGFIRKSRRANTWRAANWSTWRRSAKTWCCTGTTGRCSRR